MDDSARCSAGMKLKMPEVKTEQAAINILFANTEGSSESQFFLDFENQFPHSEVHYSKFSQDAERIIAQNKALKLIVADLNLSEPQPSNAENQMGISFLEKLMDQCNAQNILVLSDNVKSLSRLKDRINAYSGGFAVAEKSLSTDEIFRLANLVMQGHVYLSKSLRQTGMIKDIEEQWLEVVKLKFQEGLNDKAIAQRLHVSDRTIRNYWIRLQDTLNIPNDPSYEIRVQIMLKLKKLGLLE